MSKIKIKTLTSVHIGSGETLQYGNDFVKGTVSGEDFLGIIDAKKVMNLIGEDKINAWVTAIENKRSTDEIVKQYNSKATMEDYSKRIIQSLSKVKDTDTLKELIHDGQGRPYIPGSSIKGAIRSSILAVEAKEQNGLKQQIKDYRGRVNAKQVESELFGKDPNSDVFRFLQVGDAYFGKEYEVAIRMVNINERERQSFWDTSKPQLIEAIGPEDESSFEMKLNLSLYEKARDRVHTLPDCMKSIQTLFKTINSHTKSLLEQEISYWDERKNKDNEGKVENYIKKVNDILGITDSCDEGKSCVLRIGHGSGWRFITGAWTATLENFDSVVVPASRPRNQNYKQYDFPKTRRVDDQCELLGFVKLIIQ